MHPHYRRALAATLVSLITLATAPLAAAQAAAGPRHPHGPSATAHKENTARDVVFAGDWNASELDKGKYSPNWIASRTGMRLVSPPMGPRGRIDFPMTSARVPHIRRVSGGGSDHGLVLFRIKRTGGQQRMTGATWNVERDRNAAQRAQLRGFLRAVMAKYRPDFVNLQEASQYLPMMAGFKGYHPVMKNKRGADQNVILVRDGIARSDVEFRQVTSRGWYVAGTNIEHAPLFTTLVTLDGWLRVGSVHANVGVDWRNGRMVGPSLRTQGYRESAINLIHEFRQFHRD